MGSSGFISIPPMVIVMLHVYGSGPETREKGRESVLVIGYDVRKGLDLKEMRALYIERSWQIQSV